MGNFHRILPILGFLVVTWGQAAAKAGGNADLILISPNQSVQIATIDMPEFGLGHRNAVDLAVKLFGDLKGHPIETKHYGKGCPGPVFREDFTLIRDDFVQGLVREAKTVGLIGGTCSGATQKIIQDLGAAKILTISPANTAPFLTDPALRVPNYYRTSTGDFYQGIAGANFSSEYLGAQKAAIVHYDEEEGGYSIYLAQRFSEAFPGDEAMFPVPFDTADYSAILDAMPAVDVIYAPLFDFDFANFANQLRERNLTPLLGTDGAMNEFLFEFLEEPFQDIYLSGQNVIGPEYQAFVEAYLAEYGHEPGLLESLAFDATRLMLRALDNVAEVDEAGRLTISRQGLLDYMDDSANYPFTGAGGTYLTPVNGELNPNGNAVFQVEAGGFVPVYP